MENYQILGLVVSLLLILTFFIHPFFNGMMTMMGGFGYMTFFPMFIGIPALVLGIVGSLIDNREAGGILLLIAAFLSLPAFFGFSSEYHSSSFFWLEFSH
ncbi:hypothetical protein IC006_0600 [Sulfuracidifex tepidarius]|uniref:Uncharacterized protein n=1 Tax=Sulfuracidifex tepidarius TaxID=1294262 RepID=A0A510DSX5_9CREN|nr:hypothetical protein [Sulfuracidifex tepidarius]BBG23316.1 hypothetical protein IC006_0600 [Sulfuracidifex tepidarius]